MLEKQKAAWNPRHQRLFRTFQNDKLFQVSAFMPKRTLSEGEAWAPSLEIFEKGNKFIMRAELPGMRKSNFNITVSRDTLTIEGERKTKGQVKQGSYCHSEMCYGKFSRSVVLPPSIDTTRIEAKYDDGILEISLPRLPEVEPQNVEVTVK